jgi:hypothetical protein
VKKEIKPPHWGGKLFFKKKKKKKENSTRVKYMTFLVLREHT